MLWSYAIDLLNLCPEPDFLILADDAEDSYNVMSLQQLNDFALVETERKNVHVVNPGSFTADGSFAVIYPHVGKVEPSKI